MASFETETLGDQCPLRDLWVGIGCKRGTPEDAIAQAIQSVFQAHALAEAAIAGVATIDTKVNEDGLIAFCRDRSLPLRFFSAVVLRSIPIPNPSNATETSVGTPSVAEAAALLACSLHLLPAPAHSIQLRVPKQIVRHLSNSGFVTVAVVHGGTVDH